jgi:hypothetical protein
LKLLSIASQFLAGAIGVTFLGWVLSLTPFFLRGSVYAGLICLVAYGVAWALDDWVCSNLNISLLNYYSFLVALGVTAIVSIAVLWGILTNG